MSRSLYKTTNDLLQSREPTMYTNPMPIASVPVINQKNIDKKHLRGKWDTFDYRNTGDPNVWGPSFWFTLHNGASRYPKNASDMYKERAKGFILGIPVMIPCDECAVHATAYIESIRHNLDVIVSCRKNLFNFFVDFHNYVNKRYGKPEMSYEDAEKMYNGQVTITKFSYS
jgi:hypothetical protein